MTLQTSLLRRRCPVSALLLVIMSGSAPAVSGAQTIAITGGKVFPVSGPAIENGTVLMRDGRIVAVGNSVTVPADAQVVDASGKWVTPGLINASTHLGLVDIGAVASTRDYAASGTDGVAAAFRVIDGLNPRSVLVAQAREDGVTSAVVVPAGGMISGQAAFIDLVRGTSIGDMTVRAPLAMVAQLEDAGSVDATARGELLLAMRVLLDDARTFGQNRQAYDSGSLRSLVASRSDLEALQPVLAGKLPLLVSVNRASDIQAAMRLADEYGIKLMIAGGAEAWLVAAELAAAKIPVLTGALTNIPNSFATLGSRQDNAAILRQAGVPVVITGEGGADPDAFNVRNLRFAAGNAVAYGMTWDEALRSITVAPAAAFGIADGYGTLSVGGVANVVVWSGDPFEFASSAEHVYVHGREWKEATRQELLEQRYRSLPPNYYPPPPR